MIHIGRVTNRPPIHRRRLMTALLTETRDAIKILSINDAVSYTHLTLPTIYSV